MAPPAEGEGEGGGQRRQPQQQAGGFGQSITGIIRIAVFWYFASKFFSPKRPSGSEPAVLISNLFQKGEPLDMWFYLSDKETFHDFANESALVWHETNIPYAVWTPDSSRTRSFTYSPSEALTNNNGTLYAHVFFARSGYPPDPSDPEYLPLATFSRTHRKPLFLFVFFCLFFFSINIQMDSLSSLSRCRLSPQVQSR